MNKLQTTATIYILQQSAQMKSLSGERLDQQSHQQEIYRQYKFSV